MTKLLITIALLSGAVGLLGDRPSNGAHWGDKRSPGGIDSTAPL